MCAVNMSLPMSPQASQSLSYPAPSSLISISFDSLSLEMLLEISYSMIAFHSHFSLCFCCCVGLCPPSSFTPDHSCSHQNELLSPSDYKDNE